MQLPNESWVYKLVWDVIQTLILAVVAVYTWLLNKHQVNKDAISELKESQSDTEKKQELLEQKVDMMPSHDDLEKVHEKLNSIAKTTEKTSGTLSALTRQLDLINKHLLGNK